jgi:hypothetical protein
MKLLRWILFSAYLFFAADKSTAQEFNDSVRHSYFKFSVSYLSNSVYFGRKDSLVVPYIIPSISYHDKSGFFAEGSFSYLATQPGQIDAGDLTAGYDFHSSNEKFSGELYATKYFVSKSSYSVRGEVKGAIGTYLDYNTGPLTINGGVDISFSNKTDIALTFGASHEFGFGDNKQFAITPSALLNAGTQNFDASYFTNRKFSTKRKRRAAVTSSNVVVIQNQFSILDYELSLPFNYDNSKWGVFITPTYSIPQNPFKYSLNGGTTYQTEALSNSFYAEVGVYIKF